MTSRAHSGILLDILTYLSFYGFPTLVLSTPLFETLGKNKRLLSQNSKFYKKRVFGVFGTLMPGRLLKMRIEKNSVCFKNLSD
ncbi:MAG: hypothetical protein D6797_05595 [Bdellovibrio sp.]|nr:MAG: hypothetical protein D6797_05595 [Bdellovibrio sp.]